MKIWVKVLLVIFLKAGLCHADEVKIIPYTLRSGFESYLKNNQPLEKNSVFIDEAQMAHEAGISLRKYLYKKVIYGMSNDTFYFLFFNSASANTCPREYLVQKVRLEKAYLNDGAEQKKEEEYLVEIMKLDRIKEMKKPDQHSKRYSLQGYDERRLVLDVEIGCGEVPGYAEGLLWPFEKNKLYKRIQDYSPSPGVYHDVTFDFSTTYRVEFSFDKDENVELKLPSFLE